MQKIIFFILFCAIATTNFAQSYINRGLELTYLGIDDGSIKGSRMRLGYSNLNDFGVAAILTNATSGSITVNGVGPELNYTHTLWKGLRANIVGTAIFREYKGGTITKGDGLRWSAGINVFYQLRVVNSLYFKPIVGYTYQNTTSVITYSNNLKSENSTATPFLNYGASLSYNIKKFSVGIIPMFTAYNGKNDFGLTFGAGYAF